MNIKALAGILIFFFIFAILGILVVPIIIKNGLISKDESVKEAWAQIDTQLKRRADLIPNLVSTVQGYAKHEKDIFTQVADARSKLLGAQGPAAKAEASSLLNGALGRLLAISENYPELKANADFIRLQDELAGTENRIAVARTRYNIVVKEFNMSIRKFPGSLFAPGMNFKNAEYFQVPEGEKVDKPPEVKF